MSIFFSQQIQPLLNSQCKGGLVCGASLVTEAKGVSHFPYKPQVALLRESHQWLSNRVGVF